MQYRFAQKGRDWGLHCLSVTYFIREFWNLMHNSSKNIPKHWFVVLYFIFFAWIVSVLMFSTYIYMCVCVYDIFLKFRTTWQIWPLICEIVIGRIFGQGPVALRLMTSQLKDIVTHTQKYKTVKCIFCGVWVQIFVWNFNGALCNFTPNFKPIHHKICIYKVLKFWRFIIS